MRNVATNEGEEKLKIFQTVLSSPGMTEKCKVTLTLSRQNILLLSRLIEAGLLTERSTIEDDMIAALSQENLEEFKVIHEEILQKGALTQFYEKLKAL